MDTGGLAQMTYNNHNGLGGGLGFPGSGFGTRGKADNIKKLNVQPPSAHDGASAPRTARSHLLAGLRTAPKSPAFPTTAPPTQLEHRIPQASSMPRNYPQAPPKTATAASFGGTTFQNPKGNQFGAVYTPEQILAPPAIHIGEDGEDSQMDPRLYEELVRTNQYLAQQQMRLQQQLMNVTAAAQQFQHMNMGPGSGAETFAAHPASLYHQQLQQGVQPMVQPVPGSPGLFTVYNPMTGQTTLAYDQHASHPAGVDPSQTPTANHFGRRVSPPPQSPSPANRATNWRSSSPPKAASPPRDEATPLPPPSANAFRSHRKNNLSLVSGSAPIVDGPKTAGLKSAGFPRTPMTGTFGPGQAQEGEHPIRQPRGPPSMEDLVAKPTTKFEGSKNFASRQRRGAVKNLVRAGIERRGVRGSANSSESGSPTSDAPLSVVSDADDMSVRSGSASLEGRRDFDKPRTANAGVIGGERKELKERSRERQAVEYTAASVSSDDDLVEVKPDPRRAHLHLLAHAEQRRSQVY